MQEQESGTCSVCGTNGPIQRTYYYYEIKCDCCVGDKHFEIVYHCGSCVPKPPPRVKVTLEIQPLEKDNE
jgi:hypothetical protein